MTRARLACAAALIVFAAGCGDDSSDTAQTVTVTTPPPAAQTDTGQQPDQAQAGVDEANWALALASGNRFAAEYCVRKLGAEIGQEQPPTSAMKTRKNRLLNTARAAVKDAPDIQVNGQSLSEFLLVAADTLSTGDCDPQGAATLQRLAAQAG